MRCRRRSWRNRSPAKAGVQERRKALLPQRSGPRPSPGNKLTYKDQRDFDRLPGEIERIEAEIAKAEEALHDPELYSRDPKRFASLTGELERLRADKHSAEERWLEVASMAEELQRQAS